MELGGHRGWVTRSTGSAPARPSPRPSWRVLGDGNGNMLHRWNAAEDRSSVAMFDTEDALGLVLPSGVIARVQLLVPL